MSHIRLSAFDETSKSELYRRTRISELGSWSSGSREAARNHHLSALELKDGRSSESSASSISSETRRCSLYTYAAIWGLCLASYRGFLSSISTAQSNEGWLWSHFYLYLETGRFKISMPQAGRPPQTSEGIRSLPLAYPLGHSDLRLAEVARTVCY